MQYLNAVGIQLEKNFQIWHHRRCIMEIHQTDFDKEKDFLMEIYNSDQKNYHAWSYRLWLIERFGLWANELDFVEHEIKNGQVTNNTLWSYRYFITAKTKELTKSVVGEEIKYAMD
jgi:protein farnesyltransferase/geranylgeranyltransferase type-1 subunit alpha